MKVAIFGGAFNPVHNEHINIAKAAIDTLGLDKLIVVPTAVSPHKSGKLMAEDRDRLNMCRLAFGDIDKVEVSDYEIDCGGVSYSYKTCNHFKQLYPDSQLFFLMGADMLRIFPQWKNPQEIISKVSIAACAREDSSIFEQYKLQVEQTFNTKVYPIKYVGLKVSSTRIRVLACLKEDISALVAPKVAQYIKDNGIYAIDGIYKAKDFLIEERWGHTIRVSIMCAENAQRADLSESQAITMAALHDVAKYLKADSPLLQGFTCPEGVPNPVVHQFSGAYVAANYFNIKDDTIINAIKWHTSGCADMTKAEKLLFLCDMLEEGRTFPHVDELRDAFYKDIDYCLYLSLKHQNDYLKQTGLPIYEKTQQAFNYIKEKFQ
jgi:nicotinate-nucleotide adenylyltransferase